MATESGEGVVETSAVCWRASSDEFEGADPNKVLSFSPPSTSKDYVAELVSMSEAALNWTRTFDDTINEVGFDTERRTVLVVSCGKSDMWLTVVYDNRRNKLVEADELKRVVRTAVENHLNGAQSEQAFRSLAGVVLRYLRSKLKLETPTVHGLHDILDGLPVLSISKQSFLFLRYLENSLAEIMRSGLSGGLGGPGATLSPPAGEGVLLSKGLDTVVMEGNFILSSSLNPKSTERIYRKYVDYLRDLKLLDVKSPAGLGEEKTLSSAFNLSKLNLNFESLGVNGSPASKAISPDGFISQVDLVARRELTKAFSFFVGDDDGDAGEERGVYIFAQGNTSVVFLTQDTSLFIGAELRRRLSDLLKRSCAKLSESIRIDYERVEEPRSSNFDVACLDDVSSSSKSLHCLAERPDSLKLRLDLAAQLKREMDLGIAAEAGAEQGDSFAKPARELMVHSHSNVWASLQESGLRKYYTLSDESTLIEAHLGMRENAEKAFQVCLP
ncbi:hypothetical protein A3770_16p77670 [Chloropicon primus]|uniref:Uncharacterized protein n=2 Tax=Chloropicon primus TaxID=1764295 RepID=A0A5B8MXD0_9CHLO|nr:hypothetical protein A3770_16p77670 [Chloropicon primus]|eukprot:QDZ25249.1 hypothetical protein A3770_16p77670 [Chloropicon primus]